MTGLELVVLIGAAVFVLGLSHYAAHQLGVLRGRLDSRTDELLQVGDLESASPLAQKEYELQRRLKQLQEIIPSAPSRKIGYHWSLAEAAAREFLWVLQENESRGKVGREPDRHNP